MTALPARRYHRVDSGVLWAGGIGGGAAGSGLGWRCRGRRRWRRLEAVDASAGGQAGARGVADCPSHCLPLTFHCRFPCRFHCPCHCPCLCLPLFHHRGGGATRPHSALHSSASTTEQGMESVSSDVHNTARARALGVDRACLAGRAGRPAGGSGADQDKPKPLCSEQFYAEQMPIVDCICAWLEMRGGDDSTRALDRTMRSSFRFSFHFCFH